MKLWMRKCGSIHLVFRDPDLKKHDRGDARKGNVHVIQATNGAKLCSFGVREVHESSVISICSHPESPIVATLDLWAAKSFLSQTSGKTASFTPMLGGETQGFQSIVG